MERGYKNSNYKVIGVYANGHTVVENYDDVREAWQAKNRFDLAKGWTGIILILTLDVDGDVIYEEM